eukprot:GHVU01017739.1.p1 GENE.GHVU01017739.1~~GHVU01017739.1.p1  ORF type:complete len:454 (+),score=44.42 GHVU01017739.1:47-1363(+)
MIYACHHDDAETMAACLADWATHYGGLPEILSTDQGPHFKNKLVAALIARALMTHHLSFAHCPWSNGTAEVVNKAVHRAFQSVISTLEKDKSDWPLYVAAVSVAINNVKRKELRRQDERGRWVHVSASEAFLPNLARADVYHQLRHLEPEVMAAVQGPATECLAEAIQQSVVDSRETDDRNVRPHFELEQNKKVFGKVIRQAQMGAGHTPSAKKHAIAKGQPLPPVNLRVNSRKYVEKGDFVLVALPKQFGRRLHGKLTLNWMGPFMVRDETEPYIYAVENLVDHIVSKHHRARIRIYCEGARGNKAAMIAWVGKGLQDSLYKVEEIIDLRTNEKTGHFELEAKWLGFSKEETTWEPLATLYEDAPEHVREFLGQKNNALFRAARKTLPPEGVRPVQSARVRMVRPPPARYLDPGQMGALTEAPEEGDTWLSDADSDG